MQQMHMRYICVSTGTRFTARLQAGHVRTGWSPRERERPMDMVRQRWFGSHGAQDARQNGLPRIAACIAGQRRDCVCVRTCESRGGRGPVCPAQGPGGGGREGAGPSPQGGRSPATAIGLAAPFWTCDVKLPSFIVYPARTSTGTSTLPFLPLRACTRVCIQPWALHRIPDS